MGKKRRMERNNSVLGTETAEEYSTVSDRRSFSERYDFNPVGIGHIIVMLIHTCT